MLRSIRAATALCLLALLGVLGTGLPSHHHGTTGAPDGETRLLAADHHSHGTRLVEQDDRAPSVGPRDAAVTVVDLDAPAPPRSAPTPAEPRLLRPTERAPPPGAPRAPPLPS